MVPPGTLDYFYSIKTNEKSGVVTDEVSPVRKARSAIDIKISEHPLKVSKVNYVEEGIDIVQEILKEDHIKGW
jgi:hypothetical protein